MIFSVSSAKVVLFREKRNVWGMIPATAYFTPSGVYRKIKRTEIRQRDKGVANAPGGIFWPAAAVFLWWIILKKNTLFVILL